MAREPDSFLNLKEVSEALGVGARAKVTHLRA